MKLIQVNSDRETVKEFIELRGCRWAQNTADFLGGKLTLNNLKLQGENASFFGNILKAKSHRDAIDMILTRKAHATAVDSNALALFLKEHPHQKEELAVLTSWGPLPPYAIVARKSLPKEIRERVVDTLLNMHYDNEGARILAAFNVRRFGAVAPSDFEKVEKELIESTRQMRFEAVYY